MQALQIKEHKKIPESFIYEMSKGKPIYYRAYNYTDDPMGSSYLQVFIIMEIIKHLLKHLTGDYCVFSNEVGVIHEQGNWRSLDIAVYKKQDLKHIPLENKYLKIPPEVVIEVDTKVEADKFSTTMDYVYEKTDDLLNFGVKKVIWIFTSSRKVMIAVPGENWITMNWGETFSVMEDIKMNIEEMFRKID